MDMEETMEEEKIQNRESRITIPLISGVLSFIGGCISYFYIKNEIPLQWDINWDVSKTAPREAVFLLSALPIIFYVLMISNVFKNRKNERNEKASKITTYAVTYLLIILQWVSITVALGVDLEVKMILPVLIGIAFIVIGNFMPTVKRNYVIGFRTPWSIRNEISWKKTNRYGGYFMSILGFLMIINGIYKNTILLAVTVVVTIIGFLYGCYYSYLLRDAK
jgi:uncharacterized membrane protein